MNGSHLSAPPGLPHDNLKPDAFRYVLEQVQGRVAHSRQTAAHYQEKLLRNDQDRDQAYDELLHAYRQLVENYATKCHDIENEQHSRRLWQDKANALEKNFLELKSAMDSSPFAMAIIDGDGAIFSQDLVSKGQNGGREAAHLLLGNIKNQLKNIYPGSLVDDWAIQVQITMNLPGLAKKLLEVGIIHATAELTEFVHGFNSAQPLFSIVDVGKGKERADNKVREMARLMSRVKQCKHLFVGPCHDNGYIQAFQNLRGEAYGAPHVTLLETTPATPGFHDLGLPFTKFSVFRETPLPQGPLMASRPALTAPQPLPSPSMPGVPANGDGATPRTTKSPVSNTAAGNGPAPASSTPKAATWAAMSKNGVAANGKINIAPTKKPPGPKSYLVNKNYERIDPELPRTDPAAVRRFKARTDQHGNLCNEYHLKGEDYCDDQYCCHYHGERLTNKAEMLVLQHKARSLVCNNGSDCTDLDCYYGHHCKYGKHCENGSCRFGAFHHVDPTPCYRIYEDGTQESIG